MKLSQAPHAPALDNAIQFINDDKIKNSLYNIAGKLTTGIDRRYVQEPNVMTLPVENGLCCLIITGSCKPLLLVSNNVNAGYGKLVANVDSVVVQTDMQNLDNDIDIIVAKFHLYEFLLSKKKGGGESISIGTKAHQTDELPVTIINGEMSVCIGDDVAIFTPNKMFDTHILTLKEVRGRLHSDMFVHLLKYVKDTFDAIAWFDTLSCPIDNKEVKWSKYIMSLNNGLFGVGYNPKC